MIISSFSGDYRWLSNFWPAPVTLDTVVYPTVEHAYQAAKFPNDLMSGVNRRNGTPMTMRELIHSVPTPGGAKKYGRWKGIRADWNEVKIRVMHDLVKQKFTHRDLADKLRATGHAELIEGNYWNDRFWGVCGGIGHNHLGQILMLVRSELGAGDA